MVTMPTLRVAIAGLIAVLLGTGARADIDPAEAATIFEQAKTLSDAGGGKLWGQPLAGPILLVDPVTRQVVANRPAGDGSLVVQGDVFIGTWPEEMGIANTAIDLAGERWTMLMWPLPEESYARGRLLMHESFHRIQPAINLPAVSSENPHLDERDGRIWLQLEWRALAEALIREGDTQTQAMRDALLFRGVRHSLYEGAAETERQLELNEGLAEYTGYRLSGLPTGVLPDRVSIRLIESQNGTGYTRNFAYTSGPAYGLLLDQHRPDWRANLTPESDLAALLTETLEFTMPEAVDAEASERAKAYDGDKVVARETQRAEARAERLAAYRAAFLDGPALSLPLSGDVSYTFNPNTLESFDETRTVFGTIRVVDVWGILDVTGGALVTRTDGRLESVRVSLTDDDTSAGAGWTLKLNEGWIFVQTPEGPALRGPSE